MHIPPELAETVAAVVDGGSLEAAARQLRITPSAVSQRLRALESQLGRVLVVRSRPVRPTPSGEVVVRLARQYALLAHDASADLGADAGERMRIPLAVNSDSLSTWFLEPLARIEREHDVSFELHRDDQDLTARLLETGTVIGAVTSRREPVAGCSTTPLGVMTYGAYATAAYISRWLPDGPTRRALAAAPVVDYDRSDELQSRWLKRRGVDPAGPPRHYVPASHDYVMAVRLGMGWGLVPPMQFAEAAEELVSLGEPLIPVPLYWQQWNLRSPLLSAIADAVASAAAAVLDPV